MRRLTIDYGIDLGTTNSCIAVLEGTDQKVIKNNDGHEITPSAVWFDRKHRIHVGQSAKQQLEVDNLNAFSEFKLQMGKRQEFRFARNDRVMLPEELSAEILKSLKGDVQQRMGEEIREAVITVPAAFELPQCEATKRAAQLAGFTFSPLVLEPVAAALAYGFQSTSEKVSWLVYDLGGGTFDAALMRVRDGQIHSVNHGGDNHLGGKLIDWAIVEELLIPAVTKKHRLTDLRRGNPKWQPAIATLKHWAEEAKIRVSRAESWDITIDFLCHDDRGERVGFEYTLHRRDVERLSEPLIARSINICKSVLAEKGLSVGDIEKVLLVGGPTLMPYLRERLADHSKGLGIPLDFSQDPMTVVAMGAAIFAGGQQINGPGDPIPPGEYAIQLVYSPMGVELEPAIAGRVAASDGQSVAGCTIEFVKTVTGWRSGKLSLASDGTFETSLLAEKGVNKFLIELSNATGTRQKADPDHVLYRYGIEPPPNPPLIHSIGVALANNEVATLIEKGAPLPAKGHTIRRTIVDVRRGQTDAMIRIPIVEGENKLADRNRLIGSLEIPATKVRRDLPMGSDVEISVDIDTSRLVRTKAFIPILDEEYETVQTLQYKAVNLQELEKGIEREKKRLEKLQEKAASTSEPNAQRVLQQLDQEKTLHDVEAQAAAAHTDPDAGDKADKRLLELTITLDRLEDALEWPALLAEVEKQSRMTKEVVQEHGSSADKQKMATLERETHQAIESRDPDLLRRKIEELSALGCQVYAERPEFWVGYFNYLEEEERRTKMRDRAQADQLIAQGRRAMDQNDLSGLKAVIRQLVALLPREEQEAATRGRWDGNTQ